MVITVRHLNAVCALMVLLLLMASATPTSQTQQIRPMERKAFGQNVAGIFEGSAPNPDGTVSLHFGYLNRNYEEELDIPVGPNNAVEPGGPDRGQPTHFLPRRHSVVFKVVVPKDFGDKQIVWTLSVRGTTATAIGSINPTWQINVDRQTQTGNTPPVLWPRKRRLHCAGYRKDSS
jgi:hypothetical protein